MIEFIDTLYTPFGTTGNYSAIADLHTLQFTVTHTLRFSVFTSHILVTNFNTGTITVSLNHTLQISLYYSTHKDFSSLPEFQLQMNSLYFSVNCQLPTPEFSIQFSPTTAKYLIIIFDCRLSTDSLNITNLHGANRKHRFQQYPHYSF
jgi:hypothetical protein